MPPTEEELAGWRELPAGADELADQGARPADARAAEEFYLRTFAEPALEVNGIESGSPHLQKTVLPVEAVANVSIRLAPGQERRRDRARASSGCCARRRPTGAELEIELLVVVAARARPAGREGDPARPRRVRARARPPAGADPLGRHDPDRAGARRQGHPGDRHRLRPAGLAIHSPNERLVADYVPLGIATARELFRELRGAVTRRQRAASPGYSSACGCRLVIADMRSRRRLDCASVRHAVRGCER